MADKSKKAVVGTCYKTCTLQFRVGTFSRNVFLMLQNGQLGMQKMEFTLIHFGGQMKRISLEKSGMGHFHFSFGNIFLVILLIKKKSTDLLVSLLVVDNTGLTNICCCCCETSSGEEERERAMLTRDGEQRKT